MEEPRFIDLFVRTGEQVEAAINFVVPDGLPCLSGHFERAPIVPAFKLVEWTVSNFGRLAAREVRLLNSASMKFRKAVEPRAEIILSLSGRELLPGTCFAVKFGYTSKSEPGLIYASGSLTLEAGHG